MARRTLTTRVTNVTCGLALALAMQAPQALTAATAPDSQGAPAVAAIDGDGAWVQLEASPQIFKRNHTAIYDPVRDQMVVTGGYDANLDLSSETWALSLSGTPSWNLLSSVTPIHLKDHSAIYDPVRDRMVVYGGIAANSDAAWAFDLSGVGGWSKIDAAGWPGAREHSAAIYDPVRDQMIIFGGIRYNQIYDDTWALSFSDPPVWTKLEPSGGPPPVAPFTTLVRPMAVYDSARDRMVVLGYDYYGGSYNEIWALSLSDPPTWTQIPFYPPAPPKSYNYQVVYDPVRDRLVVWGDAWQFKFITDTTGLWRMLDPAGTPPNGLNDGTSILDAAHDRMVMFSDDELAALDFSSDQTVSVDLSQAIPHLAWERISPNPSMSRVQLSLAIRRGGEGRIDVFDLSGRRVVALQTGRMEEGRRTVTWDGRDANRRTVPPGLYLVRATIGGERADARIVRTR